MAKIPWFFRSPKEATSAVDMAKLAASQVAPDGSKICHGAQGRGILSMALTTDW